MHDLSVHLWNALERECKLSEPQYHRTTIDRSDWVWHGVAGHLIVADRCCFRLHTVVGEYRISTVGCYHPSGVESSKPETIGRDRLYETMVFRVADPLGEELSMVGYNEEPDARAGHVRMCLVWQERQNLAIQQGISPAEHYARESCPGSE
jgi:hypothetical protein